ncbi:SRPBCC family protein [Streptomyces sp. CHA1]|uniref:SRPBCC family protein n=1 Tax=Streptomyces TaxID=1883 RepID=UPI001BFCBEAB|nr:MULTISPECIES: SRPBCC family protein [unclassified Streptomyces]WSB21188.1 SRPBCC family protein [Streptomyces albidoflavus]MBT3158646.1 SRPBCC family protein [Streptomyces sp. G11C]MCO6701939.1 SRPBCC family protein [Streptomyces sp. CHB9.2]MCO6708290.1 SRPBCC family protein [Streptomyces sp. CHA3]MCO6714231.1 SRPBCC family protein [Streptomyces sp. CHB19.2]
MPNDPQRQDPQPGRGLQQAQPVLPAQRREQQAPQQQYAEARAHRVLDRAADAVWREVRDFPALAAWHPGIASSTAHPDNPRVRDLVTTDGTRLTEALHAVDDTLMSLEYGFVAHPFPLTGYRARMEVRAEGDTRCSVTWTAMFRPADGGGAALAAQFEEGVFAVGLEALGARERG